MFGDVPGIKRSDIAVVVTRHHDFFEPQRSNNQMVD